MVIVMEKHTEDAKIEAVVAELIKRGFDVHRSTGSGRRRESPTSSLSRISARMPRVHGVELTAEVSVELLAGAQTPDGAFPASPAHDVYRYAWVRDGSWCAHAMDRAGRRASSRDGARRSRPRSVPRQPDLESPNDSACRP